MAKILDIEDFLFSKPDIPVLDVRTPEEYIQGHLPGSLNLPLFSNEERKVVGILYKQKSRQASVKKALELTGPKMRNFADRALEYAAGNALKLYCWRGGMRSESMAWLFEKLGIPCLLLHKGYKAYRKLVLSVFDKELKIIVLGGLTGSGKSFILSHLKQRGDQILDLEQWARHKGSAFGGLGMPPQFSNEYFENLLEHDLRMKDLSKRIWVEDESQNIGKNQVPAALFKQMRQAHVIQLDVPFEKRVHRLVEEYAGIPNKSLTVALKRISRRLGEKRYRECLKALEKDDYAFVVRETLKYYDKTYTYGLSRRSQHMIHPVSVKNPCDPQLPDRLIDLAGELQN